MQRFSFRAECAADVDGFRRVCDLSGLVTAWEIHPDKSGLPDVEVDLQSTSSLKVLREAMREIKDGHVMLQTLRECPLADNSLERDYDVH
jgi:hypothetical protein